MEAAFYIFGMGILDAIVTQLMKDAKQQSLVIWVRVGSTVGCVLMVAPQLAQLFHFARSVLLQWY